MSDNNSYCFMNIPCINPRNISSYILFFKDIFLGQIGWPSGLHRRRQNELAGWTRQTKRANELDGGHMSWPAKLAERTKLARQAEGPTAANDSNNSLATSSNALKGKIILFIV